MPKNSSESENSVSPEKLLLSRSLWKKVVIVGCLLLLAVAVSFLFKKKPLTVVEALPSGVMAYVRMDRPNERLEAFRNSKFWTDFSKVDWEKYLSVEGASTQQIKDYKDFRQEFRDFLKSPLFKQFFSKEATVAVYPAMEGFSNGDWPANFSGFVMVFRPETKSRFAEMLGKVFSQYSKDWDSAEKRYNKQTITTIHLKKAGVKLFYARIRDLLVMTVDERVLQRVIDTVNLKKGSLIEDKEFLSLAGRFYGSSAGEVVLNVPAFKDFLMAYWRKTVDTLGDSGESVGQQSIDRLFSGLDGIRFAGGTFVVDQPLQFKWIVMFDPAQSSPGLKRLNECVSMNNPTLGLMPKETMIYQWSSCMDFAAIYEDINQVIQKTANTPTAVKSPFAFFEESWGISFENDILPLLGGEVGWFFQGVEFGGLFPVPKFGFILKVKDPAGANEVMSKIAISPVTILQTEDYRQFPINFVTVPLVNALKPSYTFIGGYLILASSNKIIKQIVDASYDPQSGLASQDVFRRGLGERAMTDQMIFFTNIQEISKQSQKVVEWTENWFNQKIRQTLDDENRIIQSLQDLDASVQTNADSLTNSQKQLGAIKAEMKSLEAQIKAAAVVAEAQNTLSQEGPVDGAEAAVPDDLSPMRELAFKKSQAAALELEMNGLERDIALFKSRKTDILKKQEAMQQQKSQAEKHRYYVEEVIIPVLKAVESLVAQKVTTHIKDGVIDSEMILTTQ